MLQFTYFDLDSLYFSSADRLAKLIEQEITGDSVDENKDSLESLKGTLNEIANPVLIIFDRSERLSRLALLDPGTMCLIYPDAQTVPYRER